MTQRKKISLLLLVIPFLLACNLSSLVGENTNAPQTNQGGQKPPAQQGGAAQPTAGKAAALPEMEAQIRQVVNNFLTSAQADPSGKKASAMMTDRLAQQVKAGKTAVQLLEVESIPKFEISAVTFSADAAQASVDATLLTEPPVNRRFTLVKAGNDWKLDTIILVQGAGAYPASPEQVVQTFVMAYQEAPDQMSKYLSVARLQQLPGGGAVGLLNINGSLEGSLIQSAAVNPNNPPSAAVTMVIRVGGKDITRIFSLIQENGQWKIASIDPGQ